MKFYDPLLFLIQVVVQSVAKLAIALLGLVIVPIGLLKTRFPKEHPFRDYVQKAHDQKYISKGSSGNWIYERLPDWPIMRPFDNLNYGLRGEHTGRYSALVRGKEHKWWPKFQQAALRNPANGLRYMGAFSCQADNCDIFWWGDKGPLQIKYNLVEGWNFVKGVDRDTGRRFYSFHLVKGYDKGRKGFRIRIGFKVEPSYLDRGDLPPRKERVTFTFRINPAKKVDPFE